MERFFFIWKLVGIPSAPFAIVTSAGLGWWQIGPSVLAGLGVMLLMLHVNERYH